MGYCRVCGIEEGTEYRASKHQTLCGPCAAETPRKASRAAFERRYWGLGPNPFRAVCAIRSGPITSPAYARWRITSSRLRNT